MERLALDANTCSWHPLGRLPGVERITYGVVHASSKIPNGVPLVQAGNITERGFLTQTTAYITHDEHTKHQRSELARGDVVIVLVGRVGDAAVVTGREHGWNAARTVAIVKLTDDGHANDMGSWIRFWLRSPAAYAWCREMAKGTTQASLSVTALRDLPVPLPPPDHYRQLLRILHVIDMKVTVNRKIAECAVRLADAHFFEFAAADPNPRECEISAVADVAGGLTRSAQDGDWPEVAWIAPADVLRSALPYLDRAPRTVSAPPEDVVEPGSLMIASTSEGACVVETLLHAVPGRGMLAVRPRNDADRLWLLHELRARRAELVLRTQGQQARELSKWAFKRQPVHWPGVELRESFSRVVRLLHDRAKLVTAEDRTLGFLATSLWRRCSPPPN